VNGSVCTEINIRTDELESNWKETILTYSEFLTRHAFSAGENSSQTSVQSLSPVEIWNGLLQIAHKKWNTRSVLLNEAVNC
jgi:hypothetical protein